MRTSHVVVFILTLLLVVLPLSGQTGTSSVTGTVTDQQERVVSGASLTLTNLATGATRETKSNEVGIYNFDFLVPGEYKLDVEANGFKKQTINNIHAIIGKRIESSLRLEVGASSETVEVTAAASSFLVNTEDASLGNNFVSAQITQLPLEAKNIVDLLSLQPGATREGYVTGARADQSNVTLDGVDVNNAQTGNAEVPRDTNSLVIGALDNDRGNVTTGPVLRLNSSLRGLAVDLPPPLGKAADEAMPLRFEGRPLADASAGNRPPGWDLSLSLGDIASAHYELQPASAPGARPAVLRGSIGLGLAADEEAPLPARGVAANLHLDSIDIDRWRSALGAGEPSPAASGSAKPAPTDTGVALEGFLPDTLAVRADRVSFGGRALHHLVAGGSRAGATWRMTLAAEELDGYVEYRAASEPAPAQIYARLARLRVPKAAESEVDRLLDGPATEQSASAWPALDIVVDALELKGRQLGRVAVDAVNRAAPEGRAGEREWELNKLDMQVPEAHFSAKGKWSRKPGAAHPVTALDFQLEIRDSGALLARFGMPGLIRRTPGSLRGTASWRGSPIDPDFTTMDGDLHLDMDAGQFLKAEPGIAKLLGVLSLQSLPRRLVLDFRDVFSEGFAFDWVRGDVAVTSGVARTENLKMKGPAAVVLMEGRTDLHKETQDLHVVVIPQIGAGTASLIAAAINPLVGLASFLAQEILHEPLTRAATREFRITGSWTDPNVVRLRGDDRTGPPGKQR